MRTKALEAAFRATRYRVETPEGCFDLRIGAGNPAFDDFLRRYGASCWGIVTACNPDGVLVDDNRCRHERLLKRIASGGWRFHPARNEAEANDWPVEPGCCVIDLSEAALRLLAAEFGQAAAVYGETGKGGVRLLWIGRSAGCDDLSAQ